MEPKLNDTNLLAAYVAAFERTDDLSGFGVPAELRVGPDTSGMDRWRPVRIATTPAALEALYRGLGLAGLASTRFPPLTEALILSYRWEEVDLDVYSLMANEPADDFAPLEAAMTRDTAVYDTLRANGYVQFARGPGGDYDPVCFDFRRRQANGDCRIVGLDHEAILCDGRIRETAELAPNFRSLVLDTIRRADSP